MHLAAQPVALERQPVARQPQVAQVRGKLGKRRHLVLVASQVALSLPLLSSAGLLLRSFFAEQQVNLGLRPDHLLVSSLDLPAATYSTPAAQTRFVLKFGSASDRLFFRWWLLKTSRTYLFACRDKRVWRMRAAQAFRLQQMPPRHPQGQHA